MSVSSWELHACCRLSWGLTYLLIILLVSVLCTIVARFASLFSVSSMFLVLVILLLYGLTIITLSFAITPFFNKAETAGGYASFATIIFSLLYLAVSLTRDGYNEEGPVSSIPAAGQWALCLMSPVAMALAIDQVLPNVLALHWYKKIIIKKEMGLHAVISSVSCQ